MGCNASNLINAHAYNVLSDAGARVAAAAKLSETDLTIVNLVQWLTPPGAVSAATYQHLSEMPTQHQQAIIDAYRMAAHRGWLVTLDRQEGPWGVSVSEDRTVITLTSPPYTDPAR